MAQRDVEKVERDPDGSPKLGYICGVDWLHELGEPDMRGPACQVFNSLDALRANKNCTDECGVVEVEIRLTRWVTEPRHDDKPTLETLVAGITPDNQHPETTLGELTDKAIERARAEESVPWESLWPEQFASPSEK